MFPVLQLGPLAIQTPGLILLAGLWLGLTLAERHAPRVGIKAETVDSLVLTSMVGGVIGARLGYIIQYPSAFFDNPISILSLNPGLLDPLTGLTVAALVALVFGQRKHLAFWPTLDALTPGIAVVAVALGFSHLASGSAFGMPADVPWAISLWGVNRHPSQIYEILAASIILISLWPVKGPLFEKVESPSGLYFLSFLAISAFARLFLEAFRGDSQIILAGIRQAQVFAWLVLATALFAIDRIKSARNRASETAITASYADQSYETKK